MKSIQEATQGSKQASEQNAGNPAATWQLLPLKLARGAEPFYSRGIMDGIGWVIIKPRTKPTWRPTGRG